MLVFWEHRLVFLATPKTGSTAIEAALESLSAIAVTRPPLLKHTTLRRYRRFIGPYLQTSSGDEFETVALMREPRDWLGSWFRYRTRDAVDEDKATRGRTFDDFVRAYAQDPKPAFADVGSQANFLRPRNGQGVDHLFRYEDLDRFVAFLEERLDFAITLPRLNVSPEGTLDLSEEGERLLRDACAEDFALYDSITPAGSAPRP
ncbi:hypothetical protein [Falsirhodobacter algicola]|uniref:Gamma-glutamyl kinase n=1 Tax=Falsirhodobacter algicola TaxID=2692330 RepID=A0A8J8MRW4_9RHOB|nr:hypothetical protein [Falsirhodobacter algicola]QUS35394.1 hypothetical protein GR316_03375 [Falsirhodobacter algicola]